MTTEHDHLVTALATGAGRALLDGLAALDVPPGPAQQRRLRDVHGDALVLLALRVAEARARAAERFPDADRLFFVPELLEQATAHPVAARRARRIAEMYATAVVLDLGCGAGSDLTRTALAGLSVRGVERDPLAAALARVNLRAVGGDGNVIGGEFPACPLPNHEVIIADPGRRVGPRRAAGTRRLIRPEDLSPRPADLRPVLAAAAGWCVKWGPGLDLDHEALSGPGCLLEGMSVLDYDVELVSWNGVVREAAFWGGALSRPGTSRRRATVLSGPVSDVVAAEYGSAGEEPPASIAPPGPWILEPDGAVLRAGLLNDLARERNWSLLAHGIAYHSAQEPSRDALARSWRRIDSLPWSRRGLQDALTAHRAGRVVVKTRGFPLSPEEVVRQLRFEGDREIVVFLHRDGEAHTAHLTLPLHRGESS